MDELFVTATWILDHAGTLVVNAPAGLRDLSEKLSIARFRRPGPAYVDGAGSGEDPGNPRAQRRPKAILKPVYGYGGREILLARLDDPNLSTLIEIATADGTKWTVCQEYLPAAV